LAAIKDLKTGILDDCHRFHEHQRLVLDHENRLASIGSLRHDFDLPQSPLP
jgi:hypothetical protein